MFLPPARVFNELLRVTRPRANGLPETYGISPGLHGPVALLPESPGRMIRIGKGNQQVSLDEGELVSYRVDDYEYMHQKGSPGWGHSDTEMFPVIGPTSEASYRVQVPRGNAIQDQHGLLRDLVYTLEWQEDDSASFRKEYRAGTRVKNAKFPDRSRIQWLLWPYSFRLRKEFHLSEEGLQILFTLQGEKEMPYMLGYHPAFRLQAAHPYVQAGDRRISLEQVLVAGSRALLVSDQNTITLYDSNPLRIETSGFRHFMLWTEVPNMICIEPITFYPYAVGQAEIHEGFDYLGEKEVIFSVRLSPQAN